MKCVLVQMDISWGDPVANRSMAERMMCEAGGADIYVLPEMFPTGFDICPKDIAEPARNGETLQWMCRMAGALDAAVVGSVAIKAADGRCYNRMYFVKPDGSYCFYDKRHLFTYGGEDREYSRGDREMVVVWRGMRFMLQVCYDLRFPVFSRNTIGADKEDGKPECPLYDCCIYVASWPASRRQVWDTLLRARALENQCYVLGVNRIGDDPQCHYNGGTVAVDAYGKEIAKAQDDEPCTITAELDMPRLSNFRKKFPVLSDGERFAKSLLVTLFFVLSWFGSLAAKELNTASYVRYGESYMGKAWATLPVTEFARFKKEGNRVGYEAIVFERRRQLAALVMAEIIERKGRFMPDIINGLEVMMEEPWWGIPAHYGKPVPLYSEQPVDLFNAESASLIAWTGKELKAELDRFSPELYKKIEREINYRILTKALGSNDWWKKAGMNWNPWICSNWLTCVMLYEKDASLRQKAVTEIEGCMKAFIDAYPEDGGCDEGTGYWDRAAASLFECFALMSRISRDSLATVTILDYQKEKVARMGAYIYKMYIANGYSVCFADAHENKSVVQLNVLWPFALYLNDASMKGFASWVAEDKDFWNEPAALYAKSGNFPTLGRELLLLEHVRELAAEPAKEPQDEAWLPDLQIATMRAKDLFVAVKGGTNGESHNHNDVGSFVVYANGNPLFIDCGVGEYTSKTFSNERYSIWTMQSDYHNLPKINGVSQKDGKQYHAEVLRNSRHSITLDIAKAYPEEAGVRSWKRTIALNKAGVSITEDYELASYKEPSCIMLMTTTMPELSKKGIVSLGRSSISYNPGVVSVEVEDISALLDPLLRGLWGDRLYRILLKVSSTAPKGKVAYTIRVR